MAHDRPTDRTTDRSREGRNREELMDWEGEEGEIKGRGQEGGNGIWRKEREGIMERRDRGREVEGKESEGRGWKGK